MSFYERTVRGALRAYKLTLSPLIGRQCRFLPTCSDYAAEALIQHGPWRGSWLAARRLCRCHPLGGRGYDPVPPPRPRTVTVVAETIAPFADAETAEMLERQWCQAIWQHQKALLRNRVQTQNEMDGGDV